MFQVYKLTRENTQPENMCDIFFEKAKGRGVTVNKTSVYAEAAIQRVLLKKVMKNFAEFTRKHLCQDVAFDKDKLCRSSTSLKTVF